jgi:hypothetical protein
VGTIVQNAKEATMSNTNTNTSTQIDPKQFPLAKLITLLVVLVSALAIQTSSAQASYITADFQVTYESGGRNYVLPGATVIFKRNGRETTRQTTNNSGWVRVTAQRGASFQIDASKMQGRCGWPYAIYWGRSFTWTAPTSGSNYRTVGLPVRYHGVIC